MRVSARWRERATAPPPALMSALLLVSLATVMTGARAAEPVPVVAAPAMTASELDSTTGSVVPLHREDDAFDALRGYSDTTRDSLPAVLDLGSGNEIRFDAAAIDMMVESLGLDLDAVR